MGMTTVLRGFKVNVSTLDAFLCANGVFDTHGTPPFFQDHPDKDPISILLFEKVQKLNSHADKLNFRVVLPSLQSHNNAAVAYVTYAWIPMSAHREVKLEDELPVTPPEGFEELRREILAHGKGSEDGGEEEGKMGLYVVYTYGIRGLYTPNEYLERQKVRISIACPSRRCQGRMFIDMIVEIGAATL